MIDGITKGDTITLECTVQANLTNWKIRTELKDGNAHSIKLATANIVDGSDDQIEVTSIGAEQSTFEIKIASGETTDFSDQALIEIEVDTGNVVAGKPEIKTIFKGSVDFEAETITWETPTE